MLDVCKEKENGSDKSIKITTKKQFEVMIDFMVKHPSIAKGLKYAEYSASKEDYGEYWEDITEQLNSIGPPIRRVASWQKVWTDYKMKLKKKLAHNKKELNSTGGGSCRLAYISAMEEQVINVLSLERVVPQNTVVFGVNNNNNNTDKSHNMDINSSHQQQTLQNEHQHERQQQEERHDLTQTSKNKRRRSEFDECRKEMLGEQTDSLNKIKELFENCNKYVKRISDTVEKKSKNLRKSSNPQRN